MIPELPISSIPQCKLNRHEYAYVELFESIGHFESTFIGAHEASRMTCKVRSFKSRIKTPSFLKEIITSSNEVFNDFESDLVVENRKLGNVTQETANSNVIAKQNVGS